MDGKMDDNNSASSKMPTTIPMKIERFCRPSTLNVCIRALCLFILGISLSCVLNVMLILPELRRKVVYERDILDRLYATTWWFAPSCGTASTLIGLIYPCMDSRLGEPHHLRTEWTSVVRCAAVFIGITHAVVKLRFQSDIHLFITVAAFSVLLWWYFDRSKNGFGLGLLIAISATACLRLLGPHGIYSEKITLVNQLWVPCLFFSGGVTVGKIGRQLAMIEYVPSKVKYHAD